MTTFCVSGHAVTRDSVRREVADAIDRLCDLTSDAVVAERGFSADYARRAQAKASRARLELVEWVESYADVAITDDTSVKRAPWPVAELQARRFA